MSEEKKDVPTFYGVKSDGIATDGTPIFDVEDEDYLNAVKRNHHQQYRFSDPRIREMIRNSGYRVRSFWLRSKSRPGKTYKLMRPSGSQLS